MQRQRDRPSRRRELLGRVVRFSDGGPARPEREQNASVLRGVHIFGLTFFHTVPVSQEQSQHATRTRRTKSIGGNSPARPSD